MVTVTPQITTLTRKSPSISHIELGCPVILLIQAVFLCIFWYLVDRARLGQLARGHVKQLNYRFGLDPGVWTMDYRFVCLFVYACLTRFTEITYDLELANIKPSVNQQRTLQSSYGFKHS